MKKWAKALIIIAVIASGTISLLYAPLITVSSVGSEVVPNTETRTQINLIANIETSDITIEYAASNTSDWINVTWDISVRHAILIPPPTIVVSWDYYNISDVLTAIFTVNYHGMSFTSGLFSKISIIINPDLISNFSIKTSTGTINLNTTNNKNLQYIDVNLTTTAGHCFATFKNGTDIQGDLNIQTTTGNSTLIMESNSDIDGSLTAKTTFGNNSVTLRENISINNDFFIQATTGQCLLYLKSCYLNNKVITGIIETSTGGIRTTIIQRVNTTGNLTVDIDSDTGSIELILGFNITGSIQSTLTTDTNGSINDSSLSGYTESAGIYTSQYGPQSYKIDANLTTNTGIIKLQGGYS